MIKYFKLKIRIEDQTTVTNAESIVGGNKTTNKLLANAFELQEYGLYIGRVTGWEIDSKLIRSVLPPMPEEINIQDKKLYRWPNLDLPRQKVDLLKDKFNCTVTRIADRADVEIISINGMRKLMETQWYASLTYSQFYKFLAYLKKADMLTADSLGRCRDMLDGIPQESRIQIERNYYHYDNSNPMSDTYRLIQKFLDNCNDPDADAGRQVVVTGQDKIDTYHKIVNTTSQLVFDVDVANIIDEDLAVIENSELDNMIAMISSSDRDNRSLALELLSNCNVNKSYDVVSIIYYWYYDWLKDTNNWNTVNVKALRSKMSLFQNGGSDNSIYAYNNYIKNLISVDKLTKFAIDYTRERLYKNILSSSVGTDNDQAYFNVNIEDLYLREDLTNNINNE